MTQKQRNELLRLKAKLEIREPLDELMGVEQASDLISIYRAREAEHHPTPSERVDPHAHLSVIGTRLDPHRKIDERMFIGNAERRRKAYELKDTSRYFSSCQGIYRVADHISGAPIVVAECDLCHEMFAFKVPFP